MLNSWTPDSTVSRTILRTSCGVKAFLYQTRSRLKIQMRTAKIRVFNH
ncbi:hypothetical protein NC653_031919 [Populus alba x Populus x berolinensis]|uniref:Uncharacterized protein n=1 Tax=Populus alba x Populus x berolinensis TaxID=444605 RepID=A0AAD6M2F3_9ROSI|nr:hypothetical protein NC653_031919 [Populus alba x Populus x berolinensis]